VDDMNVYNPSQGGGGCNGCWHCSIDCYNNVKWIAMLFFTNHFILLARR